MSALERVPALQGPTPDRRVVAVAMSGGVDSSVAAARLVDAGYEVVGIMLRLWTEHGATGANRCCTPSAVEDARRVADRLGIPFSVIDIEDAFKRLVVDEFVAAAADGDTPNPCFRCNRHVRFGVLLQNALALGADALATGHYARVLRGDDGTFRLLRGVDRNKDQSYVLHHLDQSRLSRAMFPVGEIPKPLVRRLAEAYDLPVAHRPDSVDLCWVGPGGAAGFLERQLPSRAMRPGPIVHRDGRALGRHEGLPRYTLGQRRGLGVSTGERVYVLERDFASNTLVVGPSEGLAEATVHIRAMHWIGGSPPEGPLHVEAQVRYRAPAASGILTPDDDGGATMVFDLPQRAPAPGQGLVAWSGEMVLGGGPIAA